MFLKAIRRSRLDLLTLGGHDGSKEDAKCHAHEERAHVGAHKRTCSQVHSYKYTSPTPSLFEKIFLEKWWTYVVERWCPMWIAPNALTFGGLMLVLIAYVMTWGFSPGLAHEAPAWVYVTCAALMFAYQTADGIDGKQARRTKSGSPLGEVVDHGCDAVCTCVYGVMFVDMLGFGFANPMTRLMSVVTMTSGRIFFVVDTVSSTYTGRLPVNSLFDVQEMQICLQLMIITLAFTGVDALNAVTMTLPVLGERGAMSLAVGFGALFGALSRGMTFYKTIMDPKQASDHWPEHRNPIFIAVLCIANEIFHGVCLYFAPNLALAHATSVLLFAEAETSVMRLRVSDPDFPLFNWLSALIMILTTLIPTGHAFLSGTLLGAALFMLLHRATTLCAQITGCLGMHSNIFILKKD